MKRILVLLFLIPILTGCSLIKNNNTLKTNNSTQIVEVNQASTTLEAKAPATLYSKSNNYSVLKWQTVTIQENNSHADVNIKYPKFIGGPEIEPLNKYVSELVLKKFSDDNALVENWIKNGRGEGNHYSGELFECHGALEGLDSYPACSVYLNADYKIYSIINDIISLELAFTDFTGGGAGNHEESIIINYDLKTNRALKASELFCDTDYSTKLAPIVKATDMMQPITDYDRELKEKATSPASDYYNNVLLGYSGLTIVFPSYSIGPGGAGIARLFLPYIDIFNIICLP